MKIIKNMQWDQNCYLLLIDNKLVAIDPGYNYSALKKQLQSKSLDLILLTHYHFDHVAAVNQLCQDYKIMAYIHKNGESLVQNNELAKHFKMPTATVLKENIAIFTDHIPLLPSLKIVHAPGHSIDSTLFISANKLFTGDVLFRNAHGRVDLPDSDPKAMQNSLKQILKLDDKLEVFPGHGASAPLAKLKTNIKKYIYPS